MLLRWRLTRISSESVRSASPAAGEWARFFLEGPGGRPRLGLFEGEGGEGRVRPG